MLLALDMEKVDKVKQAHVVVSVEHDKEHTDCRRKQQESVLSKRIRMQGSASVPCANFVLGFLVGSVERRQVNVRRCFVDVGVGVRRAEYPNKEGV